MSTVLVILFSVAGFLAGLVGWLVFGMSPILALAIWVGAGPVAVLLGAIRVAIAERTRAEAIRMIEIEAQSTT